MSASYRQSNDHFTFYNENPKGKLRAQDCVIRALGYVEGGYDKVYKELSDIGFELKDANNSDDVIEEFLLRKGWTKWKQPKKENGKKYTVVELGKELPEDLIVCNVTGHMTVIDKGIIIDTWDCGDCCVGNFWTKEESEE